MPKLQAAPQSDTSSEAALPKSLLQKRPARLVVVLFVVAAVVAGWILLNNNVNSTDPTVAGRPLSNPHTHLHTVVPGVRPGTLYLGTHYGMFASSDGGKTWPQQRGVLNNTMITSLAISPAQPNNMAVIALLVSGVGTPSGVYVSGDGGNAWNARAPSGLSATAYPYSVEAGYTSGQFYAFYTYAGWYETRDMGRHWYAITQGALSNMQSPSLLADPANPDHLWLGGDAGLYETHDDGGHWNAISAVTGNVTAIVASTSAPRRVYCLTDQGLFRWTEGDASITRPTNVPMSPLPSRLVIDASGQSLYALAGQEVWFSGDGGTSWVQRFHFERGDIVSFAIDPARPDHLYAGFFMPALVLTSSNGGKTWQTLTN
ncbi:MAG TPA: hypothetical protein VJO32_15260 [Ktedonobacteraceae bacterium]|nr:hypothetical protein [Ktedonobacteraceae bacterium]